MVFINPISQNFAIGKDGDDDVHFYQNDDVLIFCGVIAENKKDIIVFYWNCIVAKPLHN